MGERTFHQIGKGNETSVLGSKKNGHESKVVVKLFEGRFGHGSEDGFDVTTAHELREIYETLSKCYPDFVVRQWIMPTHANPDKYFLAQERLDLRKPADIFAYRPEALEVDIKEQIAKLVTLLKVHYQAFISDPQSDVLPMDLIGKANLVLTKQDQLLYVDTAHSVHSFSSMGSEELQFSFIARVAWLEMLAHENPSQIMQDAFYSKLIADRRSAYLSQVINDPNSFFNELVYIADGERPTVEILGGNAVVADSRWPQGWSVEDEEDLFARLRGDKS